MSKEMASWPKLDQETFLLYVTLWSSVDHWYQRHITFYIKPVIIQICPVAEPI